jgi:colicin import membrane protein
VKTVPGFLGEKAMRTNSMTLVNSAKEDSWRLGRGKASPGTLSRMRRGMAFHVLLSLCVGLLCTPSCKVPEEESGYVGPSAVETLGMEVDEMGIQVRELRRTKGRLQREIQSRKADLAKYEQAQSEASLSARKARSRLDKSLEELNFLETSEAKALARSKQIRAWLAELAQFEKERVALEKRRAELPALLEKARTAVAAEEAELGTLNAILKQAADDKAAAEKAAAEKAAAEKAAAEKAAAEKAAAEKAAAGKAAAEKAKKAPAKAGAKK